MEVSDVNDGAENFLAAHHQSTLITHRRDGGLQASPVRVLVDRADRIVACSREGTAKAVNLARDPRFALCVTTANWVGPWMTIEGTAELVRLPDALGELYDFYLQRDGSVAPDDEFLAMMENERRLIVRFQVERTAGTAPGAGVAPRG